MNLEIVILSEVSQRKTCYMTSLLFENFNIVQINIFTEQKQTSDIGEEKKNKYAS